MSPRLLIGIFLVGGVNASPAGTEQVVLQLHVEGNVPPAILSAGIVEASGIFRKSGVRLTRRTSSRRQEREGSVETIEVLIRETALKGTAPAVLASSRPYAKSGVRVVVYYERVAGRTIMPAHILLGYTLAHEVGHVLLGVASHSDEGVMKAHWTATDYNWMQAHLLGFDESDAKTMQRNLSRYVLQARQLAAGRQSK
jgi:hypothetical protein